MRFGPVKPGAAVGAILAHSIKVGSQVMKKGRVLSDVDIQAFEHAGIDAVIVARLESGDIGEDEAASRLVRAAAGAHTTRSAAFTGRANIYADAPGLAVIDAARIDAINAIDESLTLASLAPFEVVAPGQMLATIKVIPFACPATALTRAEAIAAETHGLISVAPFRPKRAALITTTLAGTKPAVLDKTKAVLEARLTTLGGTLIAERRVAHASDAVADAITACRGDGAELVLVFGASAIVDRRDVIPAGIVAAGGAITHFGMPVDPGNLLLLASLEGVPVIGLPGCARSPKLNGFDWVLQRLVADLPINSRDIMMMGVGGLLKEITIRPQPRDRSPWPAPAVFASRIGAVVLAAGQSRRMGGPNKLLADLEGKPVIRHVVEAVLASQAGPVIVVLGHEPGQLRRALENLPVNCVENPAFANGLSTSLKAGIGALAGCNVDGAVVCLGDMPMITAAHLNRLIAAFNPTEGRAICVPTYRGKRGNPVLWGRMFFETMMELGGDVGAKSLVTANEDMVCEVAFDDTAVLTDIDTPAALKALTEAGRS